MKASTLNIGGILAHKNRSSSHAVMVLDNKLWRMGSSWGSTSETWNQKSWVFKEAPKGVRANSGGYQNHYLSVGIPVLQIDRDYYSWIASAQSDYGIQESAEEILRTAARQLGIERASDLQGEWAQGEQATEARKNFSTQVVVTRTDGKKGLVRVGLSVAIPQQLVGSWDTFLKERQAEDTSRREADAHREAKEYHRKVVGAEVKIRLDELFGEEGETHWGLPGCRADAYPDSHGNFTVSEDTLLRLLKLAARGAK